jgi:L-idonate 5-dehydrogenase
MGDIRALRIHAQGDLRLDTVADPTPAAGDAVVRVRYGGVCGSDLHYWHDGAVGASILRDPMVLGLEIVGTVEVSAADGSGPTAGQAVAIHPATTCGTCRWCTGGQPNLCPQSRYLGSAAQWPHTDGGFVDLLAVPSSRLIVIPDGLGLRRAALAEPAGIAWHAVNRAIAVGTEISGADVVIVGGGPIGLLVAAVSIFRGAAATTVIDLHEHPLRVATKIGVDHVMTVRDQLDEERKADIVFESSGSVPGLATAIRSARRGGTVVVVGQPPGGDLPVPAGLLVTRELTVTGSLRLDSELVTALQFLADPRARVDPIVSDIFPIADAVVAFGVAADAARSSKVLLDFLS